MSLTTPNRDLELLHPRVRHAVRIVRDQLQAESIPFEIFETWRSPDRQNYLYEQGRTRPGKKVTFVRAWGSYHQYGLAADFVLKVNGQWSWDDSGKKAKWWKRMHELGRAQGLERLGFETPHLQLAGINVSTLMDGNFPHGGDEKWWENLSGTIKSWHSDPPAPKLPSSPPLEPVPGESRPALPMLDAKWSNLTPIEPSGWHSRFHGKEWRYDGNGVYLRNHPTTPLRSSGVPTTCLKILDLYKDIIFTSAKKFKIAPELIIMTIATESAAYRDSDFTGPPTFRWEPHVPVEDVNPPTQGDYSAGPMQTLATTARWVIRGQHLSYTDPFKPAPYYRTRPVPVPTTNPLYDGKINIDIGTAEIKQRIGVSGLDPVLVAAAFNAGGVYESNQNEWRLRSHGDHLDRAVRWFGDACFVLNEMRR